MEISPELLAAQGALAPVVMAIPGVRGCDVGLREQDGVITDELVLRVLVSGLANIPPGIPDQISGIPVTIIQRNPQPEADLARHPTLVGGISIGHLISSSLASNGTLGGIARENNTGELRGITNEHVVGSVIGIDVYQPEFTSFPPPSADLIGKVVRTSFPTAPSAFPPFLPTGFVDAACISIGRAAAAEIVEIGSVTGMAIPRLNDPVRKRGRTTPLAHGQDHRLRFLSKQRRYPGQSVSSHGRSH